MTDKALCWDIARRLYPHTAIEEVSHQGDCSYTLLVDMRVRVKSGRTIKRHAGIRTALQFRALRFRIEPAVALAARRVYGSLVPIMIERGKMGCGGGGDYEHDADRRDLQVCEMSLFSGVRLAELLARESVLTHDCVERRKTLLDGLAGFFALAWRSGTEYGVSGCRGRVGSTVMERLWRLEGELPSIRLRSFARHVRRGVDNGAFDALPAVLTHGDLVPSNIMVDSKTWELQGLVDWAEAEYLPFGVSLYCIELVLGRLVHDGGATRFEYWTQARKLRDYFWTRLVDQVPELEDAGVQHSVRVAKAAGILLWYGYAWDEGQIDRVIDCNDGEELACLEALAMACRP